MDKITGKEPLEKDIQRHILEYLQSRHYLFWRQNNIPVFGRSGDGTRMAYRQMSKYTPKGLPDIFVLVNGRLVGLEVKRPKAKLREEQKQFAAKFTAHGGRYYVVHSLAEVETIF